MTDIDHMIAVMTAAKEGKTIQSRSLSYIGIDGLWNDTRHPCWNWAHSEYRVKPAEPRRIWLNGYPTTGCRSSVCYDTREEAAKFVYKEVSEQVEFVEVVK